MNIHLYTNVIKKVFCYLLYPTQSLDIVIIHVRLPGCEDVCCGYVRGCYTYSNRRVVVVENVIRHFTESTSVTYG